MLKNIIFKWIESEAQRKKSSNTNADLGEDGEKHVGLRATLTSLPVTLCFRGDVVH